MARFLLSISLGLLGWSTASVANPIAHVICAPSDQMKTRLEQQHRSERRSVGVRDPEQVVEIWTNDEDEWTMVLRYATGQSCIVAMGEFWQDLPTGPDPA